MNISKLVSRLTIAAVLIAGFAATASAPAKAGYDWPIPNCWPDCKGQ